MKASSLRPGMVIIVDNEFYRVTEAVHKTPGNLRAFMQTKMMRLKDGIQKEHRYAATEEVEKAAMEAMEMQFLYEENGHYHFMNTENYEQMSLTADQLGGDAHYLVANTMVKMTFCEGQPIGIDLPPSMEFVVTEAEPGLKTATASASYKIAKIETGHAIKVPQFVEVGDKIKVNPHEDKYLERVKK
ncbi:MAG: elongation factor P [Deltaproteobacteria bacterium]|nr:elongation factor P [Deltaproteobacteria bacterium]